MVRLGYALLAVAFSLILVNNAYAQTSDTQVTLSGDLQNNPVAQDILKKIEKSKKWINQIQQRDFEQAEKQKELEQKRVEVLTILQDDLKKWEKLWGYYTFDSMLKRALIDNPANATDSIYDHPLKFTASKINAGRDALQKVLQDGGGPEAARDAFVKAAKITRVEMIAANSLYNVIQKNAYYNQQILFNSDGTFDDTISGEELRKYYKDYRTNPAYLQANPFDKISWEDLGKNNADTECRDGYVLVYRTTADDYVCTTEQTAEMWVRYNMGTVVTDMFLESKDVVDIKKFQQDRISKKVENLNSKINIMQKHYEKNLSETKVKYDSLFLKMKLEQNDEEKQVIVKFNKNDSMSKKTFSHELTNIREKYAQLEENVVDEKSRIFEILENQYQTSLNNFINNYRSDSEIRIMWNLQNPVFEAE